MPVKSLLELATAVCVKNVKQLDSIGDYLPYSTVRGILSRVESAYQLRQIELNSPQIQGETGELWLRLIEKDFPLEVKSQSYKPQDPKKWYKVWEKYKKVHDKSIADGESKLKEAFTGLREDKEKNTSKVVETRDLAKGGLLRIRPRGTLPRHAVSRSSASSSKSLLHKARREAQEIARMHGSLTRPVHSRAPSARVSKAPSAMLDDYRRAAQPSYRQMPAPLEPSSAVAEHERNATFISDSEEEDDNDGPGSRFHHPKEAALPTSRSKPQQRIATAPVQKPTLQETSKPIAKPISKPKPATSPATPSVPALSSQKPRPVKLESPGTRRGSGILSNSYKPSGAKAKISRPAVPATPTTMVQAKANLSDDQPKSQPKVTNSLPRTQTSPPLAPSMGPSSPPPPQPLGESAESSSRKRRAVDIFMRPKKKLK